MDSLSYNDANLYIDVKEDSWKIWVVSEKNLTKDAYALTFTGLNNYDTVFNPDFEREDVANLYPGWGSWGGAPYNPGTSWAGKHQYMKVRLINNTTNNMLGIAWTVVSTAASWYTTFQCSNLYLVDNGYKTTTTTASDSTWITRTYDICYTNSLASSRIGFTSAYSATKPFKGPDGNVYKNGTGEDMETWCATGSFADFIKVCDNNKSYGGNNWPGQNQEAAALRFYFIGANVSGWTETGSNWKNCDSRGNSGYGAFGSWVEVDYVLFGSSVEGLAEYKSIIEASSEAAK